VTWRTPTAASAKSASSSARTYIALARPGLDVEGASVPYIAGWGSDGAEIIERDATEIDRIARRLEAALEGGRCEGEARVA
jgi:hypothetical protein